jgi:Flp pilus assembly protein TadG
MTGGLNGCPNRVRTGRDHNMVNPCLTARAVLLRFGETLQQSVSATCCEQNLLPTGDSSMPSPAASTASFKNLLRRFGRNRRGSAAVEFAVIAPVFFGLLFAIIETAIIFFAGQVLESITQSSARYVMTGQAQNANFQASDFKTYLCNQIPAAMFTCANISVDVQSYTAFSNVTLSSQIDAGGNFINNMQYNPGIQGSTVVVRVFYPWPQIVTGLGYNITNMAGSKRLLVAAAAFKNEPY